MIFQAPCAGPRKPLCFQHTREKQIPRFTRNDSSIFLANLRPTMVGGRGAKSNCNSFFRRGGFILKPRRDRWLEKWHHGPEFWPELLDGMMLLALAGCPEVGAALFLFFDPRLGGTAVSNVPEGSSQCGPRSLGSEVR